VGRADRRDPPDPWAGLTGGPAGPVGGLTGRTCRTRGAGLTGGTAGPVGRADRRDPPTRGRADRRDPPDRGRADRKDLPDPWGRADRRTRRPWAGLTGGPAGPGDPGTRRPCEPVAPAASGPVCAISPRASLMLQRRRYSPRGTAHRDERSGSRRCRRSAADDDAARWPFFASAAVTSRANTRGTASALTHRVRSGPVGSVSSDSGHSLRLRSQASWSKRAS